MKHLPTVFLLLFTATIASAGLPGFLTKAPRSWAFMQSVGGIKVEVADQLLLVDCDVSGLRKVTVKPTMVNSGIGVRKLKVSKKDNTISLTVVTSVIERGMSTSPKPVDVSNYPAGEYAVQYVDPGGKAHSLGTITVPAAK